MKECPECSMYNQESAAKCKYCGASLGGGLSSAASEPMPSRIEDPQKKADREREEKRKKLITYAGYGVIAAALVGWLIYSYVKKSKEPPPEETPSTAVTEEEVPGGDEAPDEQVEEEKPISLGKKVTLESVGVSFQPFSDAVIEGAGDEAKPDPSLLFKASTDDGIISLTVRHAENPEGAKSPQGGRAAQIEAEYILSKGRPVIIPGKKKGKSKAGPYLMFEADLGQTFERAYYVFTETARVDFIFSYPAADGKIVSHEKLVLAIMTSVQPLEPEKETAPVVAPVAAPEKGTKPEKKPVESKAAPEKAPTKTKSDKTVSKEVE